MIVHLNEHIFHRLFLTEATTDEIYQKYYTDIPYETYCRILQLDPTYSNNRMGKYTKWLLNIYRNGSFKKGDFREAKELLPIYDRYKNVVQVKDIMTLNSMGELYRVVQPYIGGDQATSKSDAIRRTKEGAEKVYEDSQWLIVIPHTVEAAQLYGKHTKWCTAAEESDNMFDAYNSEGPLYINIDKVNNRKYQFHFETSQFMDEEDEPLVGTDDNGVAVSVYYEKSLADCIGMPPGAKSYYMRLYEQGNMNVFSVIFSPVEFLDYIIKNRINTSSFNMDYVDNDPAKPGEIGRIRILGWTTFVEYEKSYVVKKQHTDEWFRYCSDFMELNEPITNENGTFSEIACVEIDEFGSNMLINKNGDFISDVVFDYEPNILPCGYVIGCLEHATNGRVNVFNLKNGCTPVFKNSFLRIQKIISSFYGSMIAIRNDDQIYIDVHGFELNYKKFYEELLRNYSSQLESLISSIEEMTEHERKNRIATTRLRYGWYEPSYKIYDYLREKLGEIIGDALAKVPIKRDYDDSRGKLYDPIFSRLRADLYKKVIAPRISCMSSLYTI